MKDRLGCLGSSTGMVGRDDAAGSSKTRPERLGDEVGCIVEGVVRRVRGATRRHQKAVASAA